MVIYADHQSVLLCEILLRKERHKNRGKPVFLSSCKIESVSVFLLRKSEVNTAFSTRLFQKCVDCTIIYLEHSLQSCTVKMSSGPGSRETSPTTTTAAAAAATSSPQQQQQQQQRFLLPRIRGRITDFWGS